jgi:hypothetical protein
MTDTGSSFIVFIFATDMNKCIDIMLFDSMAAFSTGCYTTRYSERLCKKHVLSGLFKVSTAIALKVSQEELSRVREMLKSLIAQQPTFNYYGFTACLFIPSILRQRGQQPTQHCIRDVKLLHSTQVVMLLIQNCLYSQPRIYKNASKMHASYTRSDEVYNILFPYTFDVDVDLLQQGHMVEPQPAQTTTRNDSATAGCADPVASEPPRSSVLVRFD